MSDKDLELRTVLERISDTVTDFALAPLKHANQKGAYEDYPLHKVAIWGDIEAAEILLRHGANIDAIGEDGETPLHRAIGGKMPDMVRFLVSRGAKTDICNRYGNSAQDDAMESDDPSVRAAISSSSAKVDR